MRRIRTIKPELPESESIGRLSRDARLVFILLFTQADDEGRLRGVPKLIASQIFPYDEDAAGLMEGWLTEIEREGLIVRYVFGGANFIFITGWKKHQKIDKPSASKFPAPDDPSARSRRDFVECSPKPREPSATDQDQDLDQDREQEQDSGPTDLTPGGVDARTELFNAGLASMGRMTGKSENQLRGFTAKGLQALKDDASIFLAIIREAEQLRPLEPLAWITAAIKARAVPKAELEEKMMDALGLSGGGMTIDHQPEQPRMIQ